MACHKAGAIKVRRRIVTSMPDTRAVKAPSVPATAQSLNINASGGLLVHSEGITLSRSMGDSVALVSAPGASCASVNNGTAVTDWRGYAVAPYLADYNKNSIGLDPSTLPPISI